MNIYFFQQLDSQDGREKSEHGKYSIDEANHPLPSPQDGISFESIIKDRDELEGFQKYLEKKDPKGLLFFIFHLHRDNYNLFEQTFFVEIFLTDGK